MNSLQPLKVEEGGHRSGAAIVMGTQPLAGRIARVAAATMIGSAIEAFDFLAYGTAAAIVFNKLFFPTIDATAGTIAAFGAFAAGFFARPVGGLIFGHFGDRLGRKAMLTLSLVLMGTATVLIGALPTYAVAGIWAPVLLVILRVVQGLSFGGELAGAMLMAVEHAPAGRKSLFGSLPQGGTPMGLLLSTGAFALAGKLPDDEFLSWGWRLPFLASAILILVGVFIRLRVEESPAFVAVRLAHRTSSFPARDVFLQHRRAFLLTFGAKLGEVTLYFTLVVFAVSYGLSTLKFARADILQAVMIGAALQIVTIPLFGWLGDRIGSQRLYAAGGLLLAITAVPLFMAIGTGSLVSFTVAIVIGLALNYASMFGPQSVLYGAQFPPELRYSGMSLGIQLAAAVGGGLAPIIATRLVARYGSVVPVGVYLAALGILATICALLMKRPEAQ
jgi:MFS transporter, MHS family, shikimate and dehydroshikimate transport protein